MAAQSVYFSGTVINASFVTLIFIVFKSKDRGLIMTKVFFFLTVSSTIPSTFCLAIMLESVHCQLEN